MWNSFRVEGESTSCFKHIVKLVTDTLFCHAIVKMLQKLARDTLRSGLVRQELNTFPSSLSYNRCIKMSQNALWKISKVGPRFTRNCAKCCNHFTKIEELRYPFEDINILVSAGKFAVHSSFSHLPFIKITGGIAWPHALTEATIVTFSACSGATKCTRFEPFKATTLVDSCRVNRQLFSSIL